MMLQLFFNKTLGIFEYAKDRCLSMVIYFFSNTPVSSIQTKLSERLFPGSYRSAHGDRSELWRIATRSLAHGARYPDQAKRELPGVCSCSRIYFQDQNREFWIRKKYLYQPSQWSYYGIW